MNCNPEKLFIVDDTEHWYCDSCNKSWTVQQQEPDFNTTREQRERLELYGEE